jgi:hypothetical protein
MQKSGTGPVRAGPATHSNCVNLSVFAGGLTRNLAGFMAAPVPGLRRGFF